MTKGVEKELGRKRRERERERERDRQTEREGGSLCRFGKLNSVERGGAGGRGGGRRKKENSLALMAVEVLRVYHLKLVNNVISLDWQTVK